MILILNFPFLQLIRFYQIFLSPLFGSSCRFHPSCSNYAVICFENFILPKAFFLSVYRVLRCNPYSGGGFDHPLYFSVKEYELALKENEAGKGDQEKR